MQDEHRNVEVSRPDEIDPAEIQKAQDFSRIVTRLDEAKKPLPQRKLYHFKQRWIFIAIIIIILIIIILTESF